MKPYLIEWIPFYGILKYSKRFFADEKRTSKEANTMMLFETYHVIISSIIILGVLLHFCLI